MGQIYCIAEHIIRKVKYDKKISFDFTDKKVLVVDDNIVNLRLLDRFLKEMNVTAELVTSGNDCISKVKSNKYDLIFLDHLMPVMDGVETLKRLRNMTNKLPPIVALTANSYAGIKEEYLNLGFNNYFL